MRKCKPVACFECSGTGAEKPDCSLCRGNRYVSVRKAARNGYRVIDIEDVEDGLGRCPRCGGDCCETCQGDGIVEPGMFEREVTRVLLCARTGLIPPVPYRWFGGVKRGDRRLLSSFAGRHCETLKWVNWYRDIFGDSLSLTDIGRIETEKRQADWLAQFDVDWCAYDEVGRLADDGWRARGEAT